MTADQNPCPETGGYGSSAHSSVEDLLYRAPVGLMTIDLDGTVIAHNRMLAEWLGLPPDSAPGAVVGVNSFEWLTDKSREEIIDVIQGELQHNKKLRERIVEGIKPSGEQAFSLLNVDLVTAATGAQLLHVAMIDATERVRFEQELIETRAAADEANARLTLAQERLRHSVLHDSLTGLANKALLEEQLQRVLGSATRSGNPCAIMTLDLDHFRELNVAAGYPAGDLVIQEVAARIRAECIDNEIVSRVAGDEFVIVVSPATQESIVDLSNRLHAAIQCPIAAMGQENLVTTSIGVVTWHPQAGEGPPQVRQLFAAADKSMYEAKQAGRNTTVFHSWGCADAE